MKESHAIWAEQRRRWMHPNAQLYVRHDAWRFMPPGSPRHVGRDAVEYFWKSHEKPQPRAPDHSANDAAEIEQLLQLQRLLSDLRVELKFRRFIRALKAYHPEQPRVPAGNPDGGQWTNDNANDLRYVHNTPNGNIVLAQAGFGRLVAEIPRRIGRSCVYAFGAISVIVPGPTSFSCPVEAHWTAVTHGKLLNDN